MSTTKTLLNSSIELRDFLPLMEKLTGFKISFSDFRVTSRQNAKLFLKENEFIHTCGYCLAIKEKENVRPACFSSDGRTITKAISEKKAKKHTCHAGVNEIIMPVYSGTKYLGCVAAGQVFFQKYTAKEKAEYMKYLKRLGVDVKKASLEFDRMKIAPEDNIRLAVKFLKLIVKFIIDIDREETKNSPEGKKQALAGVERIRAGRYAAIISRVKENMQTLPSSSITLKGAAAAAGMSPCHFSRIYKETTGRKFRDYTFEQRIERSKSMLTDSNIKISDIAERCGYKETSSFSRAFKKLTGEYPGAYRTRELSKV
ncbi:MAG: helix-turn-helix domain-containing protein [Candidatus Firestonebacteria bacterium]